MTRIFYLVLLLALAFLRPGTAQENRISEEQLDLDQLFMEANKQKMIGNDDKAKAAFRDILDKFPDNPAAAYELSRLLLQQDSTEKAIALGEVAVREEPDNKWYKIFLAKAYEKIGRNEAGADLYDQLIEAEPRNPDYYYQKAFFLVKQQEIKEAIQVYDQLEKEIGPTTEIAKRRHNLYLGLGDFKKAAAEYEDLAERFPNNPEYLLELAAFYEQIDDRKAALETYRRVLEIDPDHPKATLVVAGGSAPKNDELQYINSLKPVFEDPTIRIDLKVGKILPIVQQLNENPDPVLADQLLQLTDILERVHRDDAKSYAAAGDVLIAVNRNEQAAEKYIQALDYDDTVFQVWEQLQYALLLAGDARQLAKYSEYALDVFPNQALNYYHAALGYLGISDPDEALSLLEQALFMSARDENMQQNVISAIGMAYTLEGNAPEARDAFNKALELNENSAIGQTRYAYFLLQTDKTDEAGKILKRFAKIGQGQALFEETQALAGLKTGQYTEAATSLGNYLDQGGKLFPRGLELYGDILFRAGQPEAALDAWNQALDMGSKSAELKQKIANKKL